MTTRVLLAEDNDALAYMLERFLAARGHEVLVAKSGAEALSLLAMQEFGLLVLDLRLPEVNGVEVLQRLRQTRHGAGLPVIIMSGYYKGEKYAEALRRLGIRHYLEKPFSHQAFLEATEEALSSVPAPGTEHYTFLSILVDLHYSRKSGVLKLRRGPQLVFLQGVPVSFVTRGGEEFPALLVSKGLLTPPEMETFLATGEGRLYFSQSGMLKFYDLVVESRLFLVWSLLEALRTNVHAEFTHSSGELELPLVPIHLPELLYEAFNDHGFGFNADSFLSRYGHMYPGRTAVFYRQSNLIAMGKDDIATLAMIDGRRSLSDLADTGAQRGRVAGFCQFLKELRLIELHSAPTEEEAADFPIKTFFNRPLEEEAPHLPEEPEDFEDLVAEVSGSIELSEASEDTAPPQPSSAPGFEQQIRLDFAFIREKNYYELFGLTPGTFTFKALREAYFDRIRPYGQERLMELSGASLEMAQEVLSLLSAAYNTLSTFVAKERYDELLNSDKIGVSSQGDLLQAQVQFQSGKVFIDKGEYAKAEKCLLDACRLEPEEPLHSAYLAWAIYRNPMNRGSKSAQDKAEALLAKARHNGRHAELYSFRGWMLLDDGRYGLAEGEFHKALQITPGDHLAHQGLRQIEEHRQAEKKGLFRKIFG